jgi:hypothetical protein
VGAAGEQPTGPAGPSGVDPRHPAASTVELGAYPGVGQPAPDLVAGAAPGRGDHHGGIVDLHPQPVPGPDQPAARAASPGVGDLDGEIDLGEQVPRPVLEPTPCRRARVGAGRVGAYAWWPSEPVFSRSLVRMRRVPFIFHVARGES